MKPEETVLTTLVSGGLLALLLLPMMKGHATTDELQACQCRVVATGEPAAGHSMRAESHVDCRLHREHDRRPEGIR